MATNLKELAEKNAELAEENDGLRQHVELLAKQQGVLSGKLEELEGQNKQGRRALRRQLWSVILVLVISMLALINRSIDRIIYKHFQKTIIGP